MPPILIAVSLSLHAAVLLRAWQLGLTRRLPFFLLWILVNASSWLFSAWFAPSEPLFARLSQARMFTDALVRALAFFELTVCLVEGHPGLRTSARRAMLGALALATLGGLLLSGASLARVDSMRSLLYGTGVVAGRFTGFGLLLFLLGFLFFLAWMRVGVPFAWRLHAWTLLLLLLATLLPEIVFASNIHVSRGPEMTRLSMLPEFAALLGWLVLMKGAPASRATEPIDPALEGELTHRMRALGRQVVPRPREKDDCPS